MQTRDALEGLHNFQEFSQLFFYHNYNLSTFQDFVKVYNVDEHVGKCCMWFAFEFRDWFLHQLRYTIGLRLRQTFTSVLQKKLHTRAVFNETSQTIYQ